MKRTTFVLPNNMETNGRIQLAPLTRIVILIMAGMVAGDTLRPVTCQEWTMALAVAVALACIFHRRLWLQTAMMLVGCALAGAMLMSHARENRPTVSTDMGDYVGIVTSEPQQRGKVLRCDLQWREQHHNIKLLLSILPVAGDSLQLGDVVQVRGQIAPLDPNIGYHRYLENHGYTGLLYVAQCWARDASNMPSLTRFDWVMLRLSLWRKALIRHYSEMELGTNELAVISALTLGDKTMINKDLRDDYSVSGGMHVLALSGLHLGIIYYMLTLLANRLLLFITDMRKRQVLIMVNNIGVLVAIWMFVFLVGMPSSVLRAAVMLSICSLAALQHRQPLTLNSLSLAAIVLLVANPLNLYDAGFQMSFMAVLAIVLFYRPLYDLFPPLLPPLGRWVAQMTCVSIAAQIGVAPLVMLYFHRFSCYFLLANFIVIPCVTVVLYLAVFMFICIFLPSVFEVCAHLMALIIGAMNRLLDLITRLPGASIEDIPLTWQQTFLVYLILFTLYGITKILSRPALRELQLRRTLRQKRE